MVILTPLGVTTQEPHDFSRVECQEDISAYLKEQEWYNQQVEESLVYAQIMPSAGHYFLFGPYAPFFKGSYFVMGLDKAQVILIPLHKVTGKIDQKLDPLFIPNEEIARIKIKKGWMWYSITIEVKGEEKKLTLKLAKHAAGMKWHKNNLARVIEMLERL